MNEEITDLIKITAEGIVKGSGAKMPPIYSDLLQPATKQVGKTLEMLAGAVNVALKAVGSTIFGYDQMQWFEADITDRLKDVPVKDIITPKGSIVGPAIDAIRFLADEADLKNLYASLIATSMNEGTKELAHPGFVEVIKNLSSDDAKILKWMCNRTIHEVYIMRIFVMRNNIYQGMQFLSEAFFELQIVNEDRISTTIANLERLGLITSPEYVELGESDKELSPFYKKELKKLWSLPNGKIWQKEFRKFPVHFFYFNISEFGGSFAKACI